MYGFPIKGEWVNTDRIIIFGLTSCLCHVQAGLVKPYCKRYVSWLLNAHVCGHSSCDNYRRTWFFWHDRVEASECLYVITLLICVCWSLKLRWGQVAPLPLTNICCPWWIYPSTVLVNPIYIYIHCDFSELLRWTSERLRKSRLSLRMNSLGCFAWFLLQGENTDKVIKHEDWFSETFGDHHNILFIFSYDFVSNFFFLLLRKKWVVLAHANVTTIICDVSC